MANFDIAFDKTMKHEGSYSNDPIDRGGETYKGISRVYHPDWIGWEMIDDKNLKNVNHILLNDAVKNFYKQLYWNRFLGDQIPGLAQDIADELFDSGVNMGTHTAVKFLQEGLNILNRNGSDYGDIAMDGGFGETTMHIMVLHIDKEKGSCENLLKVMNALQAEYYLNIMRKNPSQEKFARGWMKRT